MKTRLSNRAGPRLRELFVLTAALVAMSWLVVRANWITFWMDWEFTGWVAPVANRLASGIRLYADQAHSPMPPLAYLLTYWITHGHAIWLTESVLVATAQSVLVLAMYCALSRHVDRPIPFIAALGSIPLYFSLSKTIFYDALVQACVAAAAVLVAALVEPQPRAGDAAANRGFVPGRGLIVVACGVVAAVALLSKQSTAAGMVIGLSLVLLLPTGRPLVRRIAELGLFVASMLGALLVLGVLISPWVDPAGLLTDVFITGSEPKGGSRQIAGRLVRYAVAVIGSVCIVTVYVVPFAGALQAQRRSDDDDVATPVGAAEPARGVRLAAAVGAVAAPLAMATAWAYAPGWLAHVVAPRLNAVRAATLTSGLVICIALCVRHALRTSNRNSAAPWLPPLFLLLFCSAVFHSLSTPDFRWTYDNNPLISLALCAVLYGARRFILPTAQTPNGRARTGLWTAGIAVCLLSCALWSAVGLQVGRYAYCTVEWPEIRHLAGAKMVANRRDIRQFVAAVRALAPDAQADTVLLLPNDPNVEAWFERPRPKLSSAVIFSDQYWDRYVERDYQALCAAPPRVVVIGPRNYWRGFQRYWNVNKGCERLIDLVQGELLRSRYAWHSACKIKHQGIDDYLDIYVLKPDDASVAAAARSTAPDGRVR